MLGLAAGSLGCSNRLFLHPTHNPIATTATRTAIPLHARPVRGRELDAFSVRLGPRECPPGAYVLAFHGNGSRPEIELEPIARMFRPQARACDAGGGIEIVAVSYPGFGRDHGTATLRGLGAAALAAYDWVHARADGIPVVIYGFSMGAAAALHVARRRPHQPPAALVLDRGPNIMRLVAGRFGWWNAFVITGPLLAALPSVVHGRANARRAGSVPAMFVIGRRDRLARAKNVETLVSAYAGPKLATWFDGGHDAWIDGEAAGIREGTSWVWRVAGIRR